MISVLEKGFIEKSQTNDKIQLQSDCGFYSLVMVVVFIIGGFIPFQYTVSNMLIKVGIAFGCSLAGIVFEIGEIKAEHNQKVRIRLLIHIVMILYFIVLAVIFLPVVFKTAGY